VKRHHMTIAFALMLGCATLKPTAEMDEYQGERNTQSGESIKVRYPELVTNSDTWDKRAREALDDKEQEDMAYYGRVAWLWWKSALLRAQAEDMNAETEQLEKDTAEAEKQLKFAQANLERTRQVIALSGQVADTQEVASAREKISDALAALKEAQAVAADTHAAATFEIAEAKLKASTDALRNNKPNDAISLAIESKAAAEAARNEASPKHASTTAEQAKLNRQKALFDSLAAVSGAQRSMVEGGVMIIILEAFAAKGGVSIETGMVGAFDKIAVTAKEFKDFSIVIEGHTDSKGNKTKNLQLSETRAQSVMSHLAGQGVSPDRMRAVGKGAAEPVADNKTVDGRARNRRIQILFVPSGG
jgi:outer membrane protein OmpA-like peptidoglycan-associated protein